MYKTILIFILFIFSFLNLDQSFATLNAQPGNINKIYSEIILTGDQLHLCNKLTKRTDDISDRLFRFYLPLGRILSNLVISNEQGERMEYNLSEIDNIRVVDVVTKAEDQNITVSYDVDLRKLKPSISFQKNKNQLFILSESPIFPTNHAKLTPDNIEYTVNASDAEGKYAYAKQSASCKAFFPLPIIYGNFKTIESSGVKAYIPNDIHVNKEALDYAISCAINARNYYTKIYGSNEHAEDVKLFFVNRRGGYALEDGIMLNQEYISTDAIMQNELAWVISHEIAHLWWGRGVKPKSTAMSEGLAELSSDLFLIESELGSPKSIYSNKNSIVMQSKVKPVAIENLTLYNANYKTIAYSKLPIILHEAELYIGRDNLKKALSDFYMAEQKSSTLSGFEEMIGYFPASYQARLRKEIDGTLDNWPDYCIKSVSGNTVVFQGDNINFLEMVPVKLTTNQGEVINDTLYFDTSAAEITKQYQSDIVKIIIDSDFATNQSEHLNDMWVKNSNSILDNKWQQEYSEQYHTFFNSLFSYLFTETPVKIDELVDKDYQSTLASTKEKLMGFDIHTAHFKINKSNNQFKITVIRNAGDSLNGGFIEGYFYEKNNRIYLKSLGRIRIT